tara:strand:+ start:5275 stop:5757 length:483 start_codon:yes stop_codon:yes gene_type:complete
MIKPGEYKIITNAIHDMMWSTKGAAEHVLEIANTLSNTDTLKQAQTFLGIYSSASNTYNILAQTAEIYPKSLKTITRILHEHILKKYNNKTIDEFLEENFLEVESEFALLANSLEYNITRIGHMSARWSDIEDYIDEIGNGENPDFNLTWDMIGGTNRCD